MGKQQSSSTGSSPRAVLAAVPYSEETEKHHDRLSQLTDDILLFILSFLTLKEAGCTCVLSSRWANLWKHIPCLNFEDQSAVHRIREDPRLQTVEIHNYVKWVDRVLELSKVSALKQFSVHFEFDGSNGKSIGKWLRYAFSHHVEKLELNLSYSVGLTVEWFHTLTKELFCDNSVNTVQPLFEFKPLKMLSLKSINVSGEDLEIFLYNCPFLEYMVVWHSSELYTLEISGPSLKLKFLELHDCDYLRSLKVCNTNLASLSLSRSSHFHPTMLLENVPSLVDVSLVFSNPCFSIGKVPSVLSGCLLQLEALKLLIGDPENITTHLEFPELIKLKKLELIVYRSLDFKYLSKLVSLLRTTPCLHEFVLECKLYGSSVPKPAKSARSGNGKILKMIDRYSLPFLKVVKISGFHGLNSDFDFLRYFVENAVALGEIIIEPLKSEEAEHQESIKKLAKQFEEELPQHIELVFLD